MKSKRRLDDQDEDLVNVLRQRFKQDDDQKQAIAKQTFGMLMNAQQQQQQQLALAPQGDKEPSYALFDDPETYSSLGADNASSSRPCYRCNRGTACEKCAFCEHAICGNCMQPCSVCEHIFCGGCSTIDYSSSFEQTFCLSCKAG
ncbi:hypothetical protein BDB00DRAFT_851525 [Zychaea mexicana]|uniref:uncharacterized protein n=1 Tax=Zychaea mexicana TaxID=64656 RepID=UPI0022FEDAD8|nr:uncharacterized protein BDB00DRAFT_851525 [Zychaea mexicana]KAI9485107.1 hypothetical protein BDB00DRAFT_851525 [Zychaea mexicana]